jgi:tetratricopeptide (TPR) repeat protein
MPIRFDCPSCGRRLFFPAVHGGKVALCPGCRTPVQLPALKQSGAVLACTSEKEEPFARNEAKRRINKRHVAAVIATFFCVVLATGTVVFAISTNRRTDRPGNETETDEFSASTPGTPVSAEVLFRKASPAVVRVDVRDNSSHKIQGSGFLISEDGLVVTNYHVIRGAVDALIVFSDGSKHQVEGVAATDSHSDLAILKVEGGPFPFLELAGNEPPSVGSKVFAIGSPQGRMNSISEGIVSGHQPLVDDSSIVAIQTTAAISHGSSGGPLFAADGKVVGVTSQSVPGGQNLNLAVPVKWLAELVLARGPLQSLASAGGQPLEGGDGEADLQDIWEAIKAKAYAKALRLLNELSPLQKSSPQYWFAVGFVQAELGNHELAVDAYKASIALDPSVARTHYNLGLCLLNLSRFADLAEAFRTAISIKPDFADGYYYSGLAYFNLGQYSSAIGSFNAVIALEPNRVGAHTLLGQSYGQVKRYKDAVDAFQGALKLAPDSASNYYWLGLAQKDNRTFEDAVESLEKAVEISPRFAHAHYCLGQVHFELEKLLAGRDRPREAELVMGMQLISARSDVMDWQKKLAKEQLEKTLGERTKSLRHLYRAAELDPNGQVGKDARALIDIVAK